MNKIIINSFAKINFGLNVVSKRTDGYHNIETIFYPIKLCDIIVYEKSDKFSFTSNNKIIREDENNLIIKAKDFLEKRSKKTLSVHIELQKHIPIGAGLGGGSSNAASTLLSLNELFGLNITEQELKDIALQLGSDVPYFLDPKPKIAEGKGEILRKINFEINYPLLIVNPGIHVSTKWAYQNIKPKNTLRKLHEIIESGFDDFSKLKGIVKNDFEEIVFEEYPELNEIKSQLYFSGAMFALMTGSGSTLFGIYPDLPAAEKAEKMFKEKYYTFIH